MKYLIFLLPILYSCNIYKETTRVQFKHTISDLNSQKIEKCFMVVPKGYELKEIKAGGENGLEYQLIYKDSSIIYITQFVNSLNDINIEKAGLADKKNDLYLKNSFPNDTLTLESTTTNGLFWKEIRIGNITYGYLNVHLKQKNEFEKSITSFSCK